MKCGYLPEEVKQGYKCANCGAKKTLTKTTNFYEPLSIINLKWDEKIVCDECGFLSMKPASFIEMMSDEERAEWNKCMSKVSSDVLN